MLKTAQSLCENPDHFGASFATDAQDKTRSLQTGVRMPGIAPTPGVSCFSFHPLIFHSMPQLSVTA
ncbi:hypothetical protein [Collimonas fungivorans]|uniref:hypothetical protein n=1 Tax=Collimonas fungivorans TaxID=158899 RepID=UPI0026EF5E19|nr:hypothetical protein [Collimonas fungivorans]